MPPQLSGRPAWSRSRARACRAAGGLNNTETAGALFVSRKTVEAHLTRVYRKLGVRSRTDLTCALVAAGLVD